MVLYSDAQPKGGSILEKASFKPQGDFVLIQLLHRGTRSIGLDETVDLTAPGSEAFRAFKSDRIFRFTLNDHGFEWGARTISDTELRIIGQVGDDEMILLDRDGHDTEVKPGDELDLGEAGTEHLRTDKRIITVFFENNPREIAAAHDDLLILAREYRPVLDEEYLPDPSVGAMMSAGAIRRARQWAMNDRAAIFHVHTHGGRGVPGFSGIDVRENAKFIPNFVSIAPHAVHGAIVLSDTAAFGQVWFGRDAPQPFVARFTEVGMPVHTWRAA